MHDVFISYSHVDAQVADAICHQLEEDGIRCWYAPRNIEPGVEWADAIISAIEGCTVMVLVFTDSSNDSRQVRREVDQALNAGKAVIPFKRTATDPSGSMRYYLSTLHWLDAVDKPLRTSIENLSERIKALLGIESQTENPREEESTSTVTQVAEEKEKKEEEEEDKETVFKIPKKVLIGAVAVVLALVVGIAAFGGGTQSAESDKSSQSQDAVEASAEEQSTSDATAQDDDAGETSDTQQGTSTRTSYTTGSEEDNYLYTIGNEQDEVRLDRYLGPETAELVLPDTLEGLPVTSVGEKCFEDCTWIEKLVLPESMGFIGYRAFYGCTNLKKMNYPTSLKQFGGWSFAHCGFEEIVLPDTFETLDYGAFYGSNDLATVVLPEAVDWLGENTFRMCPSLKSVTIPAADPEINAKAFEPASGVTIIGVAGSYTEKYAKGMALGFQAL